MHHIVKFSAIALLFALCSCSAGNGIKAEIKSITNEPGSYTVNCESFHAEETSEGLNQLNTIFQTEIEQWTDDFIQRADKISISSDTPPCLQARHLIKKNNGKILSVVTEKYVYLTGLHGNTWLSAKNFDVASDKIIYLSDLFVDDTYQKILTERINELIEQNSDIYHDLWEKPVIDHEREDKFYFDENALIIFYEPYELSYYARGVVEFPIPTEKIRGYLKPEYLSALDV